MQSTDRERVQLAAQPLTEEQVGCLGRVTADWASPGQTCAADSAELLYQ